VYVGDSTMAEAPKIKHQLSGVWTIMFSFCPENDTKQCQN